MVDRCCLLVVASALAGLQALHPSGADRGGPHRTEEHQHLQGQDYVAVPAPGVARLVLVQAHNLFGRLKGRLDAPATAGDQDQSGRVAGLGPHAR